jgi:type I restriction enzyme S subunit
MSDWKETEIGLIPKDWDYIPFKQILSEPTRNGIYKSKEYHGKGTRVVNMGEMFAFDKLPDIEMSRIELTEDELQKSCVLKDDLLFARRSLVAEGAGKCTLVLSQKEPLTFESSIIRARPNQKKAKSEYLFYLFTSKFGKYLLKTILRQVAVSGITGVDLINLKLPIAPLKEQEEIVSILSCLDAKIENLRRQNETLEQIAQTLFKHWFIDFEFPNADGKPYKSSGGAMSPSELGDIPEGWRIFSLDEIADFLNGLALQKYPPDNEIDFLPVIKIRELRAGITDNTDRASMNIPVKYIIDSGDIIFSWSGSLDVVIWNFGKGALNQHLFKVDSDKYPKWFYYYWTLNHLKDFQSIAKSKATTMGHIQRKHLTEALCNVPDSTFLEQASKIFSPILQKIINNAIQIQTLTKTRDALLPKLMSGQLRIKE